MFPRLGACSGAPAPLEEVSLSELVLGSGTEPQVMNRLKLQTFKCKTFAPATLSSVVTDEVAMYSRPHFDICRQYSAVDLHTETCRV